MMTCRRCGDSGEGPDGVPGFCDACMARHRSRVGVFREVTDERQRQDAKWGEQNHPSVIPGLEYAVRDNYRMLCDMRTNSGMLSWADIAGEELGEAIEATNDTDRRAELIQLAAVIVAWCECIDRNGRK